MDELNKRIIEVMVRFELNKSTFAKELDVSLPLITHITSGRNKPGIDIIQKILLKLETISPDWLLNGKGEMLRTQPSKPDHAGIYKVIDKINVELNDQERVNETIKSYHKILIDEIRHLEEISEIIESSSQKLKGIHPQLENIKNQLLSE